MVVPLEGAVRGHAGRRALSLGRPARRLVGTRATSSMSRRLQDRGQPPARPGGSRSPPSARRFAASSPLRRGLVRRASNYGAPDRAARGPQLRRRDRFPADRLIAVEVLSPGGQLGSVSAAQARREPRGETELEEIYYYEVAMARPGPASPTSMSTAPRIGPSTSGDGRGPTTSCSSRMAGTARRWPHRATTCTTST